MGRSSAYFAWEMEARAGIVERKGGGGIGATEGSQSAIPVLMASRYLEQGSSVPCFGRIGPFY